MAWIELTTTYDETVDGHDHPRGEKHWFNSDKIVRIKPDGTGSFIDFVDNALVAMVEESPLKIIKLITLGA